MTLEQVEHRRGRSHGMHREHVPAAFAGAQDLVEGVCLQRRLSVSPMGKVEANLAHVAAGACELGRARRVRLAGPSVAQPPRVQAHAHAHVRRPCQRRARTLELVGRHRGAEAARARLPHEDGIGGRIVPKRQVAVHVKDIERHGGAYRSPVAA